MNAQNYVVPCFKKKQVESSTSQTKKMEDSLMDLYRKASNPMRTNKQNIRLADTPFVRDDVKSNASARSRRSESSASSKHSAASSRGSRRSRMSRRSRASSKKTRRKKSSGSFNEQPAFFESVKLPPTRLSEQQQMRLRAEKTREKQVLLHELSRMQMSGSQLCRNLSMDDNLADIEYELNRTKAKDDCVSTVAFMKDAIKFGVTGIEMLNSRFKVLKLNGWSSEATRDMNRYDRSLTKLYTRYMRKGSVSPILELGFLLFGSMILCHMKNSFMGGMMGGGQTAASPPQAAAPRQPPVASRNVPFSRPNTSATTTTPTAPAPTTRRTMRRPNTTNVPSMRPTMRRPNTTPNTHPSMGPLSSLNIPQQPIATAVTPPPPPAAVVMMMGRMRPPAQMTEVLSEAGSELSFAEVDLDEKHQKTDAIDEIDASSQVDGPADRNDAAEENDSDGESMRF